MKLLYFRNGGKLHLGISTDNGVFDVDAYQRKKDGKTYSGRHLTHIDIAELNTIVQDSFISGDFFLEENSVIIGPCVPNPSKIICIGLNYRKHAIESAMDIPKIPIVFTKYNNTLTDYGNDIPLGRVGVQFDYEVELGVIIGKKCKDVPRYSAL